MKNKFTSIPIFLYCAVTLLPLLLGLAYSILCSFGLFGVLSNGFTTAHWQNLFLGGEFFNSFFYSLVIASVVVVGAIIVALFFQNVFKHKLVKGSFSYLFFVPLAIPFVVAAFLSYQLIGQSGLFSRLAFSLNLISQPSQFPDLVNDAFAFAIIITHLIIASAFFALLFSNSYKAEKLSELEEVASTLGCNKQNSYRKIVLPVLLSKSISPIIMYFIFVIGSYEIPLLLGRQNPQMISVTIARKFKQFNLQDLPLAYAMASLYTMIIIVVLFILFKSKKLIDERH